jgi:hypothetical protein
MNLEPGRLVVRRQFQRDDLLSRVWVGRVAADDDSGLWVWVSTGSAFRDIGAADGRPFRDVPFAEWGRTPKAMRELTWRGDVLMFHPPDGAHSTWLFFSPDGAFRSWYVNLEEPSRRWADPTIAGIDTVDYDLDVVVAPDRAWQWKDSDEFAYHLAHPDVYWVDDEAAVRAEGERLVDLVTAGAFPFDGTHTDFRPDPSWTVPVAMPAGWDRPRVRR